MAGEKIGTISLLELSFLSCWKALYGRPYFAPRPNLIKIFHLFFIQFEKAPTCTYMMKQVFFFKADNYWSSNFRCLFKERGHQKERIFWILFHYVCIGGESCICHFSKNSEKFIKLWARHGRHLWPFTLLYIAAFYNGCTITTIFIRQENLICGTCGLGVKWFEKIHISIFNVIVLKHIYL